MTTWSAGDGGLAAEVAALVDRARVELAPNRAASDTVTAVASRLAEPLRVAIAGKVKAGKSTLLNALVGERLAATDATECTRIVTWYRDGVGYHVHLYPRRGDARPVRFVRHDDAVEIDLGDTDAGDIDHLDVTWPSATLRRYTLIDTPGVASLSRDVAARTVEFLSAGDDEAPGADAVVYLLRRVHPTDIRVLESFHAADLAHATPVNAIGVLSRADEMGGGGPDALDVAARVANRYAVEGPARRLCQTVVPVSGLLALGGAALTESDAAALGRLSELDAERLELLLLSTDRFCERDEALPIDDLRRLDLVERLGLHGVRVAVGLLRRGATSTAALSAELVRHSGIDALRHELDGRFAARAAVLKARVALASLDGLSRSVGPDAGWLASEVERIGAGAHELAELRLLDACRSAALPLTDGERAAVERLVGVAGADPATRLGLDADAPVDARRQAALAELARWQDRAENPLSSRPVVDAARVLVRTCEGMLARLR